MGKRKSEKVTESDVLEATIVDPNLPALVQSKPATAGTETGTSENPEKPEGKEKSERKTIMHKVVMELDDDARRELLEKMCEKVKKIRASEEYKKAETKRLQGAIDELKEELAALVEENHGTERLVECYIVIDRGAKEYREEATRSQYGYEAGEVVYSRPLRDDELHVTIPFEEPIETPEEVLSQATVVSVRIVNPIEQSDMAKRLGEAMDKAAQREQEAK